MRVPLLMPTETEFNLAGDERLRPALRLAEACRYEVGHTHHATRLALRLFDELKPLHGLNEEARFWLTCAALLHDIGWAEGGASHHKAALKLIVESPLLPWDQRLRRLIGCVARYHRKSVPDLSHEHFAALSPADQQHVRVLAGVLRVADALDRSHRSLVHDLACLVTPESIVVRYRSDQPCPFEEAKARDKADLLEEVFGRRVEIEWARE